MYKIIIIAFCLWLVGGHQFVFSQENEATETSTENTKKNKKKKRQKKERKSKKSTNNKEENADTTPSEKIPWIRIELKNYLKSPGITLNSQKVLDELLELLPDYPDIFIQIEGHTSNFNFIEEREEGLEEGQVRSQKHANLVRDYLINKGFNAELIIAEGYGASKPKILGYYKKNKPIYLENNSKFAQMSNERIVVQIELQYEKDFEGLKKDLRKKDIIYKTRIPE